MQHSARKRDRDVSCSRRVNQDILNKMVSYLSGLACVSSTKFPFWNDSKLRLHYFHI